MLVFIMVVLAFAVGLLIGWSLHKRHTRKNWIKVFAELVALKNKKSLTQSTSNVIDLSRHKNRKNGRLD